MSFVLALDVMGGDKGPEVSLNALKDFLKNNKQVYCLLFGNEKYIIPFLKENPGLKNLVEVIHTDEEITNTTKPLVALRNLKKSSMRLAIQSVAEDKAQAVISSGNTGAYMALSKMIIQTVDQIDRPAIATAIPTLRGQSIMLDLGANPECNIKNFVDFSIMGHIFAQNLFNIASPTIGLLNIGTEEFKGNPLIQEAARQISQLPFLNYSGYIEGDDIMKGTTDIIISDGFTGNIALKTIEGTAFFIGKLFSQEIKNSLLAKLGVLIAQPALKRLKNRVDPRNHNGAVFLGLKKPVIKSHGGTDVKGFCNALKISLKMGQGSFYSDLEKSLDETFSMQSTQNN